MIIVNADDFGISERVNEAIVACFAEGLISSATIMPNMPAFAAACRLAKQHKLADRIGVHINLTQGESLTDDVRRYKRLCDRHGNLCFRRLGQFTLTRGERAALREEVAAQIGRCRDALLPLTHADSHHHVHTDLVVFATIRHALHECGITSLRRSRNLGPMGAAKFAYQFCYNAWLKRERFWTTDYFGGVDGFPDYKSRKRRGDASCEIMVHPTYRDDGELVDATTHKPLRPDLNSIIVDDTPQAYPRNHGA